MAKPRLRREARRLRTEGVGVREIARRLEVAQSTVSVWTRDLAKPGRPRQAALLSREPSLVVWNSGETKRCARCRLVQPVELHGRTGGGRQAWCRPCFRDHAKSRGRQHAEQVRRSTVRRREVARAWVLRHLAEQPCVDCMEADVVVLDFDHVGKKTADVAALVGNGRALSRVVAEVEKCEVVCANCHRRRTAERAESF